MWDLSCLKAIRGSKLYNLAVIFGNSSNFLSLAVAKTCV
jgi:hypothetical protein